MNMAFTKTIDQMYNYNKTVTRRDGWPSAYCGQIIMAVEKSQGLALGERVKPIHEIQLLTPRWERIDLLLTDRVYGESEVILEGFPDWTPQMFVEMLCDLDKKRPDELIHRLEFRHLIRGTKAEFTFDGDTYVLEPDLWEYQSDGTLAGLYLDNKDNINQMLLDTLRFET